MTSDSEGRAAPSASGPPASQSARERLIEATVAVAGECGLDAMTLHEVVARAGLSKRAIYEHFADKRDCFLAAARAVIARVTELTVAACRRAADPRAGIAAAVQALLDLCAAEPATARFYLVETPGSGPAGAALWREHMEATSDRMARALAAIRPGLPAIAGSMAVGGVYTLAQSRVAAGQASRLPALAPQAVAALWQTLGID